MDEVVVLYRPDHSLSVQESKILVDIFKEHKNVYAMTLESAIQTYGGCAVE